MRAAVGIGLPSGHRVIEYASIPLSDGREYTHWLAACGASSNATVRFDPTVRPVDPASLCPDCWPAGPDVIYPRPINESEVA